MQGKRIAFFMKLTTDLLSILVFVNEYFDLFGFPGLFFFLFSSSNPKVCYLQRYIYVGNF